MSAAKGTVDRQAASALSEAEVVEVVQKHFGFAVSDQAALGGEVDQNICVTDPDGRRYLLKISAATDTDIVTVHWYEQVLCHLEATAPEVPLQRLLPTTSGELCAVENTHRDDLFVRLLTWLPGTALADHNGHSDELLTEIGRTAGLLTEALSSMAEPKPQPTHDWDMLRARSVIKHGIGSITDPANRANVETVMAWYDTIEPLFADLPRSVTHQDLNDSNILATTDESGRQRITGVLDINDSLFTIRVAELAVAAAYAIVRKADPLHAIATVVAGFNSVTPLTDHELAVVFPLAAARLAMNATTWTHSPKAPTTMANAG
jgi:Ser/Thr protein kinase RdoA (MazF antagonist)